MYILASGNLTSANIKGNGVRENPSRIHIILQHYEYMGSRERLVLGKEQGKKFEAAMYKCKHHFEISFVLKCVHS